MTSHHIIHVRADDGLRFVKIGDQYIRTIVVVGKTVGPLNTTSDRRSARYFTTAQARFVVGELRRRNARAEQAKHQPLNGDFSLGGR
jgi:hypothetical protein